MAVDVKTIIERFERAKRDNGKRDGKMQQILSIRSGDMSDVSPDLFPDTGPFQESIVANMIDVAARDTSEMIAPLPTINCVTRSMVSDVAQRKASIRTKIVMAITTESNLQVQMYNGADWYLSYGFLPGMVEHDPDRNQTVIRLIDPIGCYYDCDRFGRLRAFYQRRMVDIRDVANLYPEFAGQIREHYRTRAEGMVELLYYQDADIEALVVPTVGPLGLTLQFKPNAFGKMKIRIAQRPGPSKPRGQYDDVMFVQLAKARFALLAMESASEAVQAPLIVPDDVNEVPMGPGAVIHTSNPQAVQKLNMQTPREVFTQQSQLDNELRIGSRYPEVRTGNPDASVITGRGVQALMGTMDTQVKTATAVMARFLTELMSLALEIEQWTFKGQKRVANGTNSGVPFTIEYVPDRDIMGDYTVDVQYGLMAGLDPNRWLVFGLQARSEKLISRDYLRRQMPADFDASDEEEKVDIEDMREAAKQAFAGYAQAIPVLAEQGQDPSKILAAISQVIKDRAKGVPIEVAIANAMAPPPAPPQPAGMPGQPGDPNAPAGPPGPPGGPGGPGSGPPSGLEASGLLQGVAPGQAGMMPGGRANLQTALASMGSNGQPNLSIGINKRAAF